MEWLLVIYQWFDPKAFICSECGWVSPGPGMTIEDGKPVCSIVCVNNWARRINEENFDKDNRRMD